MYTLQGKKKLKIKTEKERKKKNKRKDEVHQTNLKSQNQNTQNNLCFHSKIFKNQNKKEKREIKTK